MGIRKQTRTSIVGRPRPAGSRPRPDHRPTINDTRGGVRKGLGVNDYRSPLRRQQGARKPGSRARVGNRPLGLR